jgi:hypothetical protein
LGANKTEKAIVRVGKSVGNYMDSFDNQAGVATVSGEHSEQSLSNDLQEIVKQLLEADTSHSQVFFKIEA